jgi:diguanylate cyclase (GGDEF)-like protein
MFLDLDNFKPLNDQHGHGVGDLLLVEVAKRLKSCVRQIDTVARFGGDEFIVLLDDLTGDMAQAHGQADQVAEKIRSLLADPYAIVASEAGAPPQNVRHNGSVSIGVTLFLGQESTQEDVLIAADLAMYRAKDLGGNTVCFFDAQMQLENTAKAVLHQELRHGIVEQQFYVHYQAQLFRADQIAGVEALLRWQHPTRGWVTPAEFIVTAEKTGLILSLGLWVLETACTQLALWSTRPETAHLTMGVNVSARQFHHSNFVDKVLAVLERTGANPKQLTLELTESVLITDVESVVAKMELLKAKGIRFSLDDFGTGYCSLAYLKRLPLDELKIAQVFVRDILIDPDAAVIAKTVIVLANSLGLTVIAEGVETEAQRELLAGMGCHNYQGYLFSQALPAHEFEALVKK